MSRPIRTITSPILVLDRNDVDTDQIIPARFLTTTQGDGFGEALFADWRTRPDGSPDPSCPLNRPGAREAQILVAGSNFGCGSSREHAAWALRDFGFRVVISDRFADIFTSNAVRAGVLPVRVEPEAAKELAVHDGDEVTVDLEAMSVTLPCGRSEPFWVESFARYRLLNGVDELGFLLKKSEAIARYEETTCAR